METLKVCVACDADVAEAKPLARREGAALVRCRSCGLVFWNPQLTEEELVGLYDETYYPEQEMFERDLPESWLGHDRVLYRAVLADLMRRYPHLRPSDATPKPRMLDFGCGPGGFLVECREAGFDVRGVEQSPMAARYCRERRGLDVVENLPEPWPENEFDLVTVWEVVEHLRHPADTLLRLANSLRPGGVMCVTTPNYGCWRRRIEGAKWFNIRNPAHLAFYGRRTLSRLLKTCGLVDPVRAVFWGGRPGFGFWANAAQYVARRLNLGSDLRIYARRP